MAWVNGTNATPGTWWEDEDNCLDGNTGTKATYDMPTATSGWREYITIDFTQIWCDKIRVYSTEKYSIFTHIQVDYYDGAWHNFVNTTNTKGSYVEHNMPSTEQITKMRVRYYASASGTGHEAYLHVIQCNSTDAPIFIPTVSTQAVTNIEETTATGNGNITDLGGENCTTRGFCYMEGTSGDPTTADSTAYDTGSFGVGAYTKGLTGLTGGVDYRVRAYAINSAGTGYGTTVQMQTKKVIQENESFSIVDSKITSITKALGEAFSAVDSWIARLNFGEAFSIADSLIKNGTEQLGEAFSVVDSWVARINLSEAFSIADSLIKNAVKNLADTLNIVDSKSTNVDKSLNESFTIADSWAMLRCFKETLKVADSIIKKHIIIMKIRKIIIRVRGGSYESDIELED